MSYRRIATSYRQFIVDVTACFDILKVSGVSVQVSGRGDVKYCWDVLLLLLVLVPDPFGNGLHNIYFSITRTRGGVYPRP